MSFSAGWPGLRPYVSIYAEAAQGKAETEAAKAKQAEKERGKTAESEGTAKPANESDSGTLARVYGQLLHVNPGDVVVLFDGDGVAKHAAIIAGFGDVHDGVPNAEVYENVNTEGQELKATVGPSGVADDNPHQPTAVDSNTKEAGAGYWNADNFSDVRVVQNHKDGPGFTGLTHRPFTAREVEAAVQRVGPVTYNASFAGSTTSKTDCAGYVNRVVDALGGELDSGTLFSSHGWTVTQWGARAR